MDQNPLLTHFVYELVFSTSGQERQASRWWSDDGILASCSCAMLVCVTDVEPLVEASHSTSDDFLPFPSATFINSTNHTLVHLSTRARIGRGRISIEPMTKEFVDQNCVEKRRSRQLAARNEDLSCFVGGSSTSAKISGCLSFPDSTRSISISPKLYYIIQ